MFHLINSKQIDGSEDDIKEVNAHAESREHIYWNWDIQSDL